MTLTTQQQKQIEKKIEEKLHKKLLKKSKHSVVYLKSQFKQHVSTAIIAAFSFLIALAWKDVIIKIVQENIKPVTLEQYPYISELITGIIVTIIAVIGIAIVTNWAKKP